MPEDALDAGASDGDVSDETSGADATTGDEFTSSETIPKRKASGRPSRKRKSADDARGARKSRREAPEESDGAEDVPEGSESKRESVRLEAPQPAQEPQPSDKEAEAEEAEPEPVSYTHLTLPTILLV